METNIVPSLKPKNIAKSAKYNSNAFLEKNMEKGLSSSRVHKDLKAS